LDEDSFVSDIGCVVNVDFKEEEETMEWSSVEDKESDETIITTY